MNDHRTEKTEFPSWMYQEEDYTPSGDKEAFLTKSTKSVLSVLSKLSFNEGKDGRFSAAPSLKLFYTILFIILTASSKNYLFVLIMCAAVTVRLAFFSAAAIRQILSGTAGAVLISTFLLLPAVFIFTLDITLKYISILGEICVDILRSISLRSVGKNPDKARSFSGVLGITFLKSSEMAEEMYAAMCCRGFTGEYEKKQKYEPCVSDIFFILIMAGCVALFVYLNRIAA